MDEWTSRYYENGKKVYRKIKYDADMVSYLQRKADGIINEIKQRFPDVAKDVNYYRMETALCSFKKLFRVRQGRFLGYYLARQNEEILQVEKDSWDGIDWELFHQYRSERLLKPFGSRDYLINNESMKVFALTGNLPELQMFGDLI
jgi:hypothetical protein